jgi:hypothetical protein
MHTGFSKKQGQSHIQHPAGVGGVQRAACADEHPVHALPRKQLVRVCIPAGMGEIRVACQTGAISAWRGSATAATVMSASSERKDFIIVSERRPYPMNPMRFIIPFLHFLCGAAFLYITYKRRANGFCSAPAPLLYARCANNYLILANLKRKYCRFLLKKGPTF